MHIKIKFLINLRFGLLIAQFGNFNENFICLHVGYLIERTTIRDHIIEQQPFSEMIEDKESLCLICKSNFSSLG